MSANMMETWNYLASFERSISIEERDQIYNDLSSMYDKNLAKMNMTIHRRFAARIAELFEGNKQTIQLLDVGSGTGILGEELQKCGFQNIDGLDPARKMLEISSAKKIYRNLHVGCLNDYVSTETIGKYDGVVSLGVLLPNHLPPEHLEFACALTKTGGYLGFMTRAAVFDTSEQYGQDVVKYLQELENADEIEKMEWSHFEGYHGKEGTKGLCILYRKK